MGAHRSLRHAAALAAIGALLAAVSCLDPTEVTLVITTDVQCSLDRGTSITVAGTIDEFKTRPALTVTKDCNIVSPDVDDSGALTTPASIGTLVVVPSGGRSDSFAVRVIMAVDPNTSPMDCVAPAYTNCIVADREVTFIPHTPITLPIEITVDCKNIVCSKGLTCVHGQCSTDVVQNCTGGGPCTETIPPDASTEPPESGGPDVSTEPSTQDGSPSDQLSMDQTLSDVDADTPGNDVTVSEAAGETAVPGDAADATAVDVTASDVASDSTSQEASTVDSPPDVHPDAADASIMDGPRDVSTVDVGVDAGADADAAQPAEGGPPSDGGILGVCPVPNSNGGVLCNGGQHCASGKVCCVNIPMFSAVTEACTDISACNVASVSYPFNWGLACRNAGDCPVGTGCCYQAADGGGGVVTTCTSSCPPSGLSPTPKGACQNSCECGGLTPVCNELVCLGAHYGVCGGTAGGSICP